MSAKRVRPILIGWALVCVLHAQASAQVEPTNRPPGCRGSNADIPEPWHVWSGTRIAVTAAISPAVEAKIAAGTKAAVTLAPAAAVRMAVTMPDTNPPPDAHSGMLSFQVPNDGIYWVSVSTGLWVDVVQGGKIVMEADERPGPRCSNINKSLEYRLRAGEARIQLSDNRGARVDLLVVRQP